MTRYFNTSGPNIPEEHYTLKRENLIQLGLALIEKQRYFTIWAPRQTGKSTYFRLLAKRVAAQGYKAVHLNAESWADIDKKDCLDELKYHLEKSFNLVVEAGSFGRLSQSIKRIAGKMVLIIDEIERMNPDLFGDFLHMIRDLYHSRDQHCLKSVILVGVSNIVGVVFDNASPFNISDNLGIPFFTQEEVFELLGQHEAECGQIFEDRVKDKIAYITACQPGLVNGFASKLVTDHPGAQHIVYQDYLKIEDWFINEAMDKNISNIINKAGEHSAFVERLLFDDSPVKFRIHDSRMKFLYVNGVIMRDDNGNVLFHVPLYKKVLRDAFFPFTNGESDYFFEQASFGDLVNAAGIQFDNLIKTYKEYVKRRSFRSFREKDKLTGAYKQIKEAALCYSFETYISFFLQQIEAHSYLEPHVGLGRSDLIVNFRGREQVVETKIYRNSLQLEKGKKQLACYCLSLGIKTGIYLVFVSSRIRDDHVMDDSGIIEGVELKIYRVDYDEDKDF